MTHSVIFLPAAKLEMIEAHDWYEAEIRGLGSRFVAEVDRQAGRIAKLQQQLGANPLIFQPSEHLRFEPLRRLADLIWPPAA